MVEVMYSKFMGELETCFVDDNTSLGEFLLTYDLESGSDIKVLSAGDDRARDVPRTYRLQHADTIILLPTRIIGCPCGGAICSTCGRVGLIHPIIPDSFMECDDGTETPDQNFERLLCPVCETLTSIDIGG